MITKLEKAAVLEKVIFLWRDVFSLCNSRLLSSAASVYQLRILLVPKSRWVMAENSTDKNPFGATEPGKKLPKGVVLGKDGKP